MRGWVADGYADRGREHWSVTRRWRIEIRRQRLAQAYAADAVDMEAAAVAQAAQAHGIEFGALKAISDMPRILRMPPVEKFVSARRGVSACCILRCMLRCARGTGGVRLLWRGIARRRAGRCAHH